MVKNSFIIFQDTEEVIQRLTDEQAGKILKAMFVYNRTNVIPELEQLLQFVFIPIKQSIDRNSEKWAETKTRRAEAGRLGGIKSGKIRNEAKRSIASNDEANEANEAVSVSDSVNVSGSVSVSVSNIEPSTKAPTQISNKFIKPSVQDIKEYCLERKNTVNALKFFDFYESKGWKVGKTPMKDWKACVRTWEATEEKPQEPEPQPSKYEAIKRKAGFYDN